MPQNDKHQYWMMHIDLLEGVSELLVSYCQKMSALICCEENGEETGKPHVHILLALPEPTSAQTLINRLKKHFVGVELGRGTFSHTVWRTHGLDKMTEQYVCKGPSKTVKTPPIVRYMSWLDDVNEHHENYWKRHYAIQAENAQPKGKAKLSYSETIIQDVITSIKDDHIPSEDIFRVACERLCHKFKGQKNDHILFPMVQRIEYEFNPSVVKEELYLRLLKKKSNY